MRVKIVLGVLAVLIVGLIIEISENKSSGVLQENVSNKVLQRIDASVNKPVSDYKVEKCVEIKHIDGSKFDFCTADFDGTTTGLYDVGNKIMIVGSTNQYTLVHEIFHAVTMHQISLGNTDFSKPEIQEKMAYDAEEVLRQINSFVESEGQK